MNTIDRDLLVIGAGPVGLYAAYYAGFRAGGASVTGTLGVDTELVAAYEKAPAGCHSDELHGTAA